jgi:hypothetical protein
MFAKTLFLVCLVATITSVYAQAPMAGDAASPSPSADVFGASNPYTNAAVDDYFNDMLNQAAEVSRYRATATEVSSLSLSLSLSLAYPSP